MEKNLLLGKQETMALYIRQIICAHAFLIMAGLLAKQKEHVALL